MKRTTRISNGIPIVAVAGSALIHSLTVGALVLGSVWGGDSHSRITPVEIEIIFEDEDLPELEPSALLEDLDALVEKSLEDEAVQEQEQEREQEEELPILEPALPEDVDPLFLPDSSEFEDLPEGLEDYVETGQTSSNLNADLSQDMLSTEDAVRAPANDQFPRGEELQAAAALEDDNASEGTDTAATTPETEETAQDAGPPANLPLIPKPRPRAAPTYRDLAAEQRETEAAEAAAAAAAEAEAEVEAGEVAETADGGDDSSATNGENSGTSTAGAGPDQNERETRASQLVQACIGVDWSYPYFIQNSLSWQVTFRLNLDAEGRIVSHEDGKIAYPSGATREMIEAFRDSARDNVYGCEVFENPEGDTGEPFEIDVILAPGAAINASN